MNLKRCINCIHRDLWDAGSRCQVDGHYIGYCETWDDRCERWQKDTRKPGEISVYTGEEVIKNAQQDEDHQSN